MDGIISRTEVKSCFGVHCILMSRNLLTGNHEGSLQVVQYHGRREGPQCVFLDLGFVVKILMRNGSRFRIESMHRMWDAKQSGSWNLAKILGAY